MNNLRKNSISNELNEQDENDFSSNFLDKIYDDVIPNMSFINPGPEKSFIKESIKFLTKKRGSEDKKKTQKSHTKYTYDNLKRKCKHLVIENVMVFINKKIKEAYNGKIGDGVVKKELVKLNQSQKRNSSTNFNKLFLNKTLKEILSQNITNRIKFYKKDHNKEVIEKVIEEKKDIFESLFNITFKDCVNHFIGNKQIDELNGLTLFSELKEQILEKNKNDGESFYKNLEIFMKEFEERINNARSNKKKLTDNKKISKDFC